jgi:hypothetical protein
MSLSEAGAPSHRRPLRRVAPLVALLSSATTAATGLTQPVGGKWCSGRSGGGVQQDEGHTNGRGGRGGWQQRQWQWHRRAEQVVASRHGGLANQSEAGDQQQRRHSVCVRRQPRHGRDDPVRGTWAAETTKPYQTIRTRMQPHPRTPVRRHDGSAERRRGGGHAGHRAPTAASGYTRDARSWTIGDCPPPSTAPCAVWRVRIPSGGPPPVRLPSHSHPAHTVPTPSAL